MKRAFYISTVVFVIICTNVADLKAQQFNSDSYLVMPHGTGTFVLTAGQRNSSFAASFGFIPKFEFFAQTFLY